MKYRPARYDGILDAETAALLQVCTQPGGWYLMGADGHWDPYVAPYPLDLAQRGLQLNQTRGHGDSNYSLADELLV
jgi:hypothetical protein